MFFMGDSFRRWQYTSVNNEPDNYKEQGSLEAPDSLGVDIDAWPSKRQRYGMILNGLFFLLSLWLFTMAMISMHLPPQESQQRNNLLRKTSEPSPLFDEIDIPLTSTRLNGTFLEAEPLSIFRQPPSPEVDAAWARIESQRPVPISHEYISAHGKDPARAAKFPESFGFGKEAYIGRIDVFHQIHCLNRLRMHLKDNYDYYYADSDTNNEYHRLHVSHCVYMLLQNLMCTANVDVYPHTWIDAQQNAFPDFSINHKCRDFGAILKYHDDHSVPIEVFGALRRPADFEPLIMNHKFKTIFQWYDNHPDDGDLGTEIL